MMTGYFYSCKLDKFLTPKNRTQRHTLESMRVLRFVRNVYANGLDVEICKIIMDEFVTGSVRTQPRIKNNTQVIPCNRAIRTIVDA